MQNKFHCAAGIKKENQLFLLQILDGAQKVQLWHSEPALPYLKIC